MILHLLPASFLLAMIGTIRDTPEHSSHLKDFTLLPEAPLPVLTPQNAPQLPPTFPPKGLFPVLTLLTFHDPLHQSIFILSTENPFPLPTTIRTLHPTLGLLNAPLPQFLPLWDLNLQGQEWSKAVSCPSIPPTPLICPAPHTPSPPPDPHLTDPTCQRNIYQTWV